MVMTTITELLRSVMEETEEMPEEGARLRKDLEECFQDISCFLLPYPGNIDFSLISRNQLEHFDFLFDYQAEV